MRIVLATILLVLLSACGNKGPLFLPSPGAQAEVKAHA
ncbi:MAG: lipoprotein [Rhodocyclaceae bacterium]|nr:lipoprotein [Rhodocyclaceae bacterium]MBK6908304.1 lipoprotein [Rhodocyclaceae bacterium]